MTFRPGSREGVQKKTIIVETNDPSAQSLQLEVRANVEIALAISPAAIVFPAFAGASGSPQPLYARISGSQGPSVNITGVECSNKLLSVEVNRDGFDGDPGRQVKFSVRPGMPIGRFREKVVLKTDSDTVPTLSLFVMGEALGAISVTPRHLSLGTVHAGTPVRRLISVKAVRNDFSFRVIDVKSSTDDITAELVTVTPGREYQVAVSVAEGFSGPVIRGEIAISTDDRDQPALSVRVFGRTVPNMQNGPQTRPANGSDIKDPF